MQHLIDVSATLATTPPPAHMHGPGAIIPAPAGRLSAGCLRCSGRVLKEGYEDMPPAEDAAAQAQAAAGALLAPPPPAEPLQQQQQTYWSSSADDLLFADDEFQTGQVDAPPAAPYADPLSNPGATMYSGSVNMLSGAQALGSVTAPNAFRATVGASTLGTPTAFAPPPPGAAAAPLDGQGGTATTQTTWMPMGLSNTQALVLAILVCTGLLLLLFIIGMGSAPAAPVADPLLAGL